MPYKLRKPIVTQREGRLSNPAETFRYRQCSLADWAEMTHAQKVATITITHHSQFFLRKFSDDPRYFESTTALSPRQMSLMISYYDDLSSKAIHDRHIAVYNGVGKAGGVEGTGLSGISPGVTRDGIYSGSLIRERVVTTRGIGISRMDGKVHTQGHQHKQLVEAALRPNQYTSIFSSYAANFAAEDRPREFWVEPDHVMIARIKPDRQDHLTSEAQSVELIYDGYDVDTDGTGIKPPVDKRTSDDIQSHKTPVHRRLNATDIEAQSRELQSFFGSDEERKAKATSIAGSSQEAVHLCNQILEDIQKIHEQIADPQMREALIAMCLQESLGWGQYGAAKAHDCLSHGESDVSARTLMDCRRIKPTQEIIDTVNKRLSSYEMHRQAVDRTVEEEIAFRYIQPWDMTQDIEDHLAYKTANGSNIHRDYNNDSSSKTELAKASILPQKNMTSTDGWDRSSIKRTIKKAEMSDTLQIDQARLLKYMLKKEHTKYAFIQDNWKRDRYQRKEMALRAVMQLKLSQGRYGTNAQLGRVVDIFNTGDLLLSLRQQISSRTNIDAILGQHKLDEPKPLQKQIARQIRSIKIKA